MSTLDTHGRKHEEKEVLGSRDFEDEPHDEEANPREDRSVMKSSVEATHRHRVISTGSGEKRLEADGFSHFLRAQVLPDNRGKFPKIFRWSLLEK